MSATLNISSHTMARQQTQPTRQQRRTESKLELLPAELQLIVLEHAPSYKDLNSLVTASHTLRATYDEYKKTILAHVTQAMLGDSFVEACMLQHWQSNVDNHTEGGEDNEPKRWPQGPYRHIQLKFLHDRKEHAKATPEDQIQNMMRLLTAEDFQQIKKFYEVTVEPLTTLFDDGTSLAENWHRHWAFPSSAHAKSYEFTPTERQIIAGMLYGHELCCRLYGPHTSPEGPETIDMGTAHCEMMQKDFFEMHIDGIEKFEDVYETLAGELHRTIYEIRGSSEWKTVVGRRYMHVYEDWPDPLMSMDFVWMHGWTAGALSMGLELLSTLRSAETAGDKAAILAARNPPELDNFMWDAIVGLDRDF